MTWGEEGLKGGAPGREGDRAHRKERIGSEADS